MVLNSKPTILSSNHIKLLHYNNIIFPYDSSNSHITFTMSKIEIYPSDEVKPVYKTIFYSIMFSIKACLLEYLVSTKESIPSLHPYLCSSLVRFVWRNEYEHNSVTALLILVVNTKINIWLSTWCSLSNNHIPIIMGHQTTEITIFHSWHSFQAIRLPC